MRASHPPELDNGSTMQLNSAHRNLAVTGSVAILWDMENCPVPSEVRADDVAGNIRMALRLHPVIQGAVTLFSAYGDFNHFSRKVREGCQRTGVNLIDVPNGKKDASDKAILVDLFLFALDNPPPCTIFLISGDVDFAPALHKLGQRGYTVVLAIPSGVGVSSALCSAGRFVWDWPSVARGGGLVPAKNFSFRGSADDRMAEIIEINGYAGGGGLAQPKSLSYRGGAEGRVAETIEIPGYAGQAGAAWSPSDDSDPPSDDQAMYWEEQIVWKSPCAGGYGDHSVTGGTAGSIVDSASLPYVRSLAPSAGQSPAQRGLAYGNSITPCSTLGNPSQVYPPGSRESSSQMNVAREASTLVRVQADSVGSSVAGRGTSVPVQIGNLQTLKEHLVKLLALNGGKLDLVRVPAEYSKQYGRALLLADYGCTKLVQLLEKLREWLIIRGEGTNKTLHLVKRSRGAAKLKREAKNGRSVSGEEIELSDCTKTQAEVLGNGEEDIGVVDRATQNVQSLIEEVQSLLPAEEGVRKIGELDKDLEEIQVPAYDWGFGSGGSGDEKDSDSQDEKDVQVDESTIEQVVKDQGGSGTDGLELFRQELQELLVSHACKIVLTSFGALYEQRYSQVLDYEKFGVQDLESLIEKVSDTAVVMEEPGSNLKYLVAN